MEQSVFEYDSKLIEALKRVYGVNYIEFLNSLARPSTRLYVRVNTLKIDPGEVLDLLRMRGYQVYRDEELEEALYFTVSGPHRIDLHDKVVVADKNASESVVIGSNLYVPGVKRCSQDIAPGDLVTIVSPNNIPIAEGIARMSCRDMRRAKKGLAVEVFKSLYRAPRIRELPEFQRGYIYPQSLASMYVSRVLEPQPHELIVDMCAAPGGKTGHIVELSRGSSYIIAFDHSKKKIHEMSIEIDRLGHRAFVEIWRWDSRYIHIDFPWLKPHKVLVDPPCTALGVRPKLYDKKSYRDIVIASRYQEQFLRTALTIVRPMGIVVYSTCTVTIEENEELIERLADSNPCIEIVDTGIKRGSRGVYGKYRDLYTRFHPHIHDTTGYFIAKLRRKC